MRLQDDLYAKLKDMRHRGVLQQRRFTDVESAVEAAVKHVGALGPDGVFEVYARASGSGFFAGSVSSQFLRSCLKNGYEGLPRRC